MLVGLLLAEFGLRLFGGTLNDDFIIADPDCGWALRPNFTGWMDYENFLKVHINSAGFRDREHSVAKPIGTVRFAILGDSYMQGMNVPLEKTFSSFLEGNLNGCLGLAGKKAEVINFGVSGYGTAQELLTFRHHAVDYKPDVVLLAFYTNNDVYNNYRPLNPASHPDHSPYFVFEGENLVLDDSFKSLVTPEANQPWFRRMRVAVTTRLMTARLLYQAYGSLRPQTDSEEPSKTGSEAAIRDADNFEDQIYSRPVVPEIKEAWRVTEGILLMLNREVRDQGAELWIVTLSNVPQVNPNVSQREEFRKQLGIDSLFYPDLRIRDFAKEHGIPVITLAPKLAEYTAAHNVYLNGGYEDKQPLGTGHWNETGNRLAAELVSTQLCSDSSAISALFPGAPTKVERNGKPGQDR